MNYDQLIKNWHSKASDEDYFSKFVFEYLAFVAFLKKKLFIEARSDRQAIQRLKQDVQTQELYISEIQENDALRFSWTEIIAELNRARLGNVSGNGEGIEEIKWWNCSHLQMDDQTPEEKEKIKGVIQNLEDWGNMIEFLYSIRNNLFHGAKDPESTRDRILVEHGYKTLRPLVQILLHHRGN